MSTQRLLRGPVRAALAGLMLAAAGSVAAQPASGPEPSKETRQQMAMVHEQMAQCLRSDKTFAECHTQMQTSCRAMMGAQGCPMMGMGRGSGRSTTPPPTPPDKP
jgi:hypothetical protein